MLPAVVTRSGRFALALRAGDARARRVPLRGHDPLRRLAQVLALLFALPFPTGCQAPAQYGGPIAIDADGFHERWQVLCGLQRAPSDATRACAPPPAPIAHVPPAPPSPPTDVPAFRHAARKPAQPVRGPDREAPRDPGRNFGDAVLVVAADPPSTPIASHPAD